MTRLPRLGLVILVLAGILHGSAQAGTRPAAIRLVPSVGPPTSQVTVVGRRFGSQEDVVIRFDGTLVGSATTDSTGAFNAAVDVPAKALPGSHSISARGRSSHLKARATFLVRTDWPSF